MQAVDDREALFLERDNAVTRIAYGNHVDRAVGGHTGDTGGMDRVVPEGHAGDVLPRFRDLLPGEVIACVLAIGSLNEGFRD